MKDNNRIKIGGGYEYSPDGTLYYTEGKKDNSGNTFVETTAIANHTPLLKEQRVIDNGIEITEELVFSALRDSRKGADTAVTLKDVLSQTPNIKFGAACRIFLARGAKSKYSEAMQIQCESAPVSMIYQHTGYTMVEGERVFLNNGFSVTKGGLTDRYNVALSGQLENYRFTDRKDSDRYKTLLELFPAIAPASLVYAGLGLSFLTPLNALLRDCGIEPCFILYFTGKTGSRKTTMAKLLLNFFGSFNNGTPPTASFRDTSNAVEKKFALTDSTLVLLDDRIPSTTAKIKAQMEAMEQAVARQIGDRSGRARMNADGSLKITYRPKCNLIVTAEESYSNVGESAIARSLSVELKPEDIDLKALTVVQQNADHLNQCMSDYIRYIIANWDSLGESLKPLFMELRDKAQVGGHGRLAECVAHLQIGIIVMCEWLLSDSIVSEAESDSMKQAAWAVFMGLAEQQNRRIVEEKPVKLFIDAVREMRDRGTIRIADLSDSLAFNSSTTIGYKDSDFYYFYPDGIYSAVKTFYLTQDKNFPLGKSALFQQLAIDKLIETDKQQTTKTKRIKGELRPRLLWLRASALDYEKEEL